MKVRTGKQQVTIHETKSGSLKKVKNESCPPLERLTSGKTEKRGNTNHGCQGRTEASTADPVAVKRVLKESYERHTHKSLMQVKRASSLKTTDSRNPTKMKCMI